MHVSPAVWGHRILHYHLAFKHLLYGITGVLWLRPCHPSTRLSCSYSYHPASLRSEVLALFNTDSMSPSHPPTSCLCGCETGASWEGICAVCPALSALSPISRTTHSGAVIGSPLPGCILNTDIPHRASIHLQQEREGNYSGQSSDCCGPGCDTGQTRGAEQGRDLLANRMQGRLCSDSAH